MKEFFDQSLHRFLISSLVIPPHFHNKTSLGLTNSRALWTVADNIL